MAAKISARPSHTGWDPDKDPPPREAVERSHAWVREVLRSEGRIVVDVVTRADAVAINGAD